MTVNSPGVRVKQSNLMSGISLVRINSRVRSQSISFKSFCFILGVNFHTVPTSMTTSGLLLTTWLPLTTEPRVEPLSLLEDRPE